MRFENYLLNLVISLWPTYVTKVTKVKKNLQKANNSKL